ncbi:hypothetical protein QTP70_008652 [Hemibagrus guttatus]|uniref:Alkylated DNA repair protein AlkB homologue 8 N-terminal domain-containing protein n=1 Tax=Hemibagrus guttatus TaxID=175788 RepID=A0AAE0UW35_9TELE|nr:hypothetical protein QTP70_008652 [Hemibagrus guttatus]
MLAERPRERYYASTTITKELKWEQNIRSLTKKAQQRMYFLRQLKKFLLPVKMLVNFYTAIIESILTSSITVWFAAATARDKAKLQRVIHSAEKVIGCSLPSLQELTFHVMWNINTVLPLALKSLCLSRQSQLMPM